MVIAGAVDTALLRGRGRSSDDEQRLVSLVGGEQVFVATRPRSCVRSPERPVGIDCPLGRGQVRGIGTALQRVSIIEHEVVQGSAYARLVRAERQTRRPWSHYLASPGRIEAAGRPRWGEIAEALASPAPAHEALDLGSIARRVTDEVQNATRGSAADPLHATRVRLCWVAEVDQVALPGVHFELHDRRLRVMRLRVDALDPAGLAAACEDIALHDWLLSTVIDQVRRAALGVAPRTKALRRLGPVVDRLLHLWMPAAQAAELTESMWTALDRGAGFSRQWATVTGRIRDQFALALAESLPLSRGAGEPSA